MRWSLVAPVVVCALLACGGGGAPQPGPGDGIQVVLSSVPLITSPDSAVAADGTAWFAWAEGTPGDEFVAAAAVDPSGRVTRSDLPRSADRRVQRETRLVTLGTQPLLAWYSLADDGIGRVHVAARAAGSWRAELQAESAPGAQLQLVGLPGGEALLMWFQAQPGAQALVAARRTAAGVWSEPAAVASLPAQLGAFGKLRVAVAGDGSVMAVWPEAASDTGPFRLRSVWFDAAAGRWQVPVAVAAVEPAVGDPAIAALPGGGWLAAWTTGDASGAQALRAAPWQGGSWAAQATTLDTPGGGEPRELHFVAQDGGVRLLWTALAAGPSSNAVATAGFDAAGRSWSAPVRIWAGGSGQPVVLRAAGTGAGPVTVAWALDQGDHDGPHWARQLPGGAWQPAAVLDASREGWLADLAQAPSGELVFSWVRFEAGGRLDLVIRRFAPR